MDSAEIQSSGPIYLTKEGYKRLKAELDHLTVAKRAEIAERIRASKEHGEYSEDNNELDEVMHEQAIVEQRIGELKAIFQNVEVLDKRMIPTSEVGLGSKVTVRPFRGKTEFEVMLVASVEADPDMDLISEESPMGAALIGKKKGETAEFEAPAGSSKFKVVSITR